MKVYFEGYGAGMLTGAIICLAATIYMHRDHLVIDGEWTCTEQRIVVESFPQEMECIRYELKENIDGI